MKYRLMKYRPIKCDVIIYGYDADGYKGSEQIFADVKTRLNMLKWFCYIYDMAPLYSPILRQAVSC